MQLSIIIPALNERDNLTRLIPLLIKVMPSDVESYEIIVVDGRSHDGTSQVAEDLGAIVVTQHLPGYGGALKSGFEQAQGEYILTMDADLSHPPAFLSTIWQARDEAEVVIASRYVPGGAADMPWFRYILSRLLNFTFTQGLSLPIQDVSSGFRLYRASVLHHFPIQSAHFDVLEEILIQAHAHGWRIVEVPFRYEARYSGKSHVSLLKFGWAYLKTFLRMWRLRNSIDSADYDYRAYDSLIPLQRYWQRTRHKIILNFARDTESGSLLDVGCGSSRILLDLPNAIGVDIKAGKIRYIHRHGANGLVGSAFALPFPNACFDCLISSQVIEHLPADPLLFEEMARLIKPGGRLILGTPDYGGWIWPLLEFLYGRLAPGGYADEHITRYTQRSLEETLESYGFECEGVAWVARAEMIMSCRKR
ncbi:MAG TPA: glycosyltransferase [Chloroflexi bacterium]|nr:glycosyltransferase [Chloroflexota bacterium]